jgi:GH35 family endo-1,4-beta-xylanase
VILCLLLAIAQIALAGYQLGVGNQTIQIAFLERSANPSLFSTDQMVTETMPLYPSYFFRGLGLLVQTTGISIATLYLLLQMATGVATLCAVYWLSRNIFRMHAAALAAVALLVAGHLRALAGDTLYSQGFTHTFAALPIAIAALALAFGSRKPHWIPAFILAGILFNIHALTAAYLLLMLGAGLLADLWNSPAADPPVPAPSAAPSLPPDDSPPRSYVLAWAGQALLSAALFILLAAPTLLMMARQPQVFDSAWIDLMRIRSADHSFPASWWAAGNPDVPRFLLVFALFVLAWSFSPVRRGQHAGIARARRMTFLMTVAILILFAAGYLFTEIWTLPAMIRLQPFRASRLLMILMLVYIAHAAVAAIRAGWTGHALSDSGDAHDLSLPLRIAEFSCGCLVLATLGIPWLLPLLPLTLLVALAVALAGGHLSWRQAVVAAAALLVALLAWRQIDFPLPGLSRWPWVAGAIGDGSALGLGVFALCAACALAILVATLDRSRLRMAVLAAAVPIGILLAAGLYITEQHDALAGQRDLGPVATWARRETPENALFLTPNGFANFRLLAQRSLVGDWRDGTQLYFDAAFGPAWLDRITSLEPGLTLSQDGKRLISRGENLATLSDQQLVDLAASRYHASYIILPTPPADHPRLMPVAYHDGRFTVYEPRLIATVAPKDALNPAAWEEMQTFMKTVVEQNIEKYRKSDLTLQLVDPAGRPLQDVRATLNETKSAFTFSGSLGYFLPINVDAADGDLDAPQVRPIELQKFPEVFNGSLIPFSAKWAAIEPRKGVYQWNDLDAYVDYCTKHDLTMEFHHLTGVRPEWVAQMGGPGGEIGLSPGRPMPAMQAEFNRHCLAVLDRYHDRIKYFQVMNEKYMMPYVPEAWKLLKQKYPDVQFGLSDCVNFYNNNLDHPDYRTPFGMKGFDAIEWLRQKGIQPDFFSMHGHHPSNVWSDPREMYAVLDKFQEAGIRVHVSEEYLRLNGSISGNVRRGLLTPELQADYLEWYFKVCFSHPSVDLVNLWGALAPNGWSNSGLIDARGKPLPGFDRLKKLFNETWHTRLTASPELDGAIHARVFQGAYHLTLDLPGNKQATATFNVPDRQPTAKIKIRVDPAAATATLLPD